MSHPRLIYPLLEGFLLGEAISEHDGVRCYPALRQKTGEKHIVKVVSIPASRVKLDALLLTGAYSHKDDALRYFKDLAQDMVRETQILRQLSSQEGFVPYSDSQIISNADGNGYEVYLLSVFRNSLDAIMSSNSLTRRGLAELGLDLCAALAACRRAGYLYVDLKPANIYYSPEQGYRIGDIGFVQLSSLQFTTLQDKYRSCYTAPEMADDFSLVSTTADIYALGLVLYQACNGGELPEKYDPAVPPLYADYEMAGIIAKATAPDPAQRWQDPVQMAHALISYMQRNEVSDLPLIPQAPEELQPDENAEAFLPEATAEELAQEMAALQQDEQILPLDVSPAEEVPAEDLPHILAQADDLIAHELPQPAVAPPPVEVPVPKPIVPQPEPSASAVPVLKPMPAQKPQKKAAPAPAAPQKKAQPARPVHCPAEKRPFPWKIPLYVLLITVLLLAGFSAKQYYDTVYIQTIDSIEIALTADGAIVKIITQIDENLLTVICTDNYGNAKSEAVVDGIARFTDLNPQTRYTIRVEISGTHKLTGVTTETFTVPAQTTVLGFTAGIGPEDASVILNIVSSGPQVDHWTITYWAQDVGAKSMDFAGNSVTLYNLQVGKEYTFQLSAANHKLSGTTEVRYTASNIILAQNLAITACAGGSLTAQWEAPEGVIVTGGWAIRCHNGNGYDQTYVTYEPWYTFTGLDHSVPCTIEVTASGMMRSAFATIGADPITVGEIAFSVSTDNGLTIRWDFVGAAPAEGWKVFCSIDGVEQAPITTAEASASFPAIPGGQYTFRICSTGEQTVFGGTANYALTEVGHFIGLGIHGETLRAELSLPSLTLTAPAGALIESSDDVIPVLYILRSSNGELLQTVTEEVVWNTLWTDSICTLTVPTVPKEPGSYVLSVYFAGGQVAEVEFTME